MPDQAAISELIQELPDSVHLMALSALILGVIVLLAGGRVLCPLVALLGATLGAAIGLSVTALFPRAADPVLAMLIGAGIGLVLAVAMYRFYMAIALALLFGAAAPVGVFAFNSITGMWQSPAEGPLPIEEQMLDDVPVASGDTERNADSAAAGAASDEDARTTAATELAVELLDDVGAGEAAQNQAIEQFGEETGMDVDRARELGEHARPVLDGAGRVMRSIFAECRDRFMALPAGQQWAVMVAGIIGAVLGAIIGLLLPKSAATLVTSAAGSAVALSGACWLAARYQVPFAQDLPTSPVAMLIVWATLWLAGSVFQWTTTREKPDD